jgi:hypothetical protein
MQFLRQNTAVIVTVGPFYDKGDGVTIETALTITNERITLTADTDAGSAPTNILDNVTGATSGTSNDLNYITGNDAGMMQLELAAADTNRVGRMLLSITDAANHVPVFHEYFVLPQAIFDWFTGVIVPLPANVTTWLGTAAATPTVAGVPEVDVTHWIGTAAATADTAGYPVVTIKDGTGAGEIATTSGAIDNVTLTATVTTYTGNTPQTGDSYAIVNSGTHGNAAIKGYVDDIGTAGAGLTAVPWNASWDAEVQSEVDDALVVRNLTATVQSDLDNIQTRLPTTLSSGNIKADVILYGGNSADAYFQATVASSTLPAFTALARKDADAQAIATSIGLNTNYGSGAGTYNATTDSLEALQAEHDATQTSVAALPTAAQNATAVGSYSIPDSYATDGAQPTIAQALLEVLQFLTEKSVTSTTLTVNKPDGTSAAMTFTLNDASSPTSITRAT